MKYAPRHQHTNTSAAASQAGFTIVELMIATVVSTVILLVITFGIVHFTNDYYKGVNSSATQTATQTAIDSITQAIQFNASGTVATDGTQSIFCAGTQVFLYTLGKKLSAAPSSSNWGLYQLDNPSANCVTPPVTTGGTELLGTNMRLAAINLVQQGTSNVWRLDIRVAYGEPELLCRTSITGTTQGSCANNATNYNSSSVVSGDDVSCKLQTGSQFCSVVHLTTAIGQRIAG
jgi:prepilin-type N-terminal cleavage/methylation domain-containing protein